MSEPLHVEKLIAHEINFIDSEVLMHGQTEDLTNQALSIRQLGLCEVPINGLVGNEYRVPDFSLNSMRDQMFNYSLPILSSNRKIVNGVLPLCAKIGTNHRAL